MRLPCIPLFLAVAIRPVGAGAHGKPSGVVTTTGQSEVQSHLRVQERVNDQSEDERMNSVLEEIISAMAEDGVQLLEDTKVNSWDHEGKGESDPWIHEGTSDATNMNLNVRKRKIEMPTSPKKKVRVFTPLAQDFYNKIIFARMANMDSGVDGIPHVPFTEVVPFGISPHDLDTIVEEVNTAFLSENRDPTEVFELYGLQFAYIQPFKQNRMQYWVKYLKAYNADKKTKKTMLQTIVKYYDIGTLLDAFLVDNNISELELKFIDESEALLEKFGYLLNLDVGESI